MIAAVLPPKIVGLGRDPIGYAVLCKFGHDHGAALRAAEHLLVRVAVYVRPIVKRRIALNGKRLAIPRPVNDRRGPHVAIPGLFLGEDGETEFVPPLKHLVQVIQLRRGMDYGGEGIRYGLLQLTHPFLGHMGGAQDQVKSLAHLDGHLVGKKSRSRCGDGYRPDLALAGPTFRHNEPHLAPLQLALDGLCHRKLGVVEGIAGVLLNVLVDCQHFRGQRFRRRVKERYEQLLDPLRHGNAEGIEVFRDRVDFVQRV